MHNEISKETLDRSSKEAVVKQISNYFRERIKSGALSPGMILPSIRSIGRQLKVDAHDIRTAMDSLREEHLVKMKPGRDGGTIVLAENEWKHAALLLPDTAFGHWEMVYKEVSHFLKYRGWNFELFTHHGQLDLMHKHLNTISNGDYAGMIFALPIALLQKSDESFGALLDSGFPALCIGGGINCWSVDDRLYECGYWGTKHLIDQKYKRIAFVGCRSYDGEVFIDGCKHALEDAGLDDQGIGYAEDEEFALKILDNWLNLEKRPDAIFYQRSDHGQRCFYTLQAKGIEIGPEMGFMVLDDTLFHRFTAPGPSAIRRHPDRIGKNAVDLFLELVNLPKKERIESLKNPKRIDTEFSLELGRSSSGRRRGGIIYRAVNPY